METMRRAFAALCALAFATTAACDRVAPAPASAPQPSPPRVPSSSVVIAATPPRPPLLTAADLDVRIAAIWQQANVTPTSPADDATWLRRAWLDIAGTIPPAAMVRRFLADASADKRLRATEDLLASPAWADHWAAYWDDALMGRNARGKDVDRDAFRAWLRGEFAANTPWNRIAEDLLTATGINSDRGAVNWTLKYQESPQDLAGAASRTFLGVQIQCAQCHDHKTEKWTQKDFQRFAAVFVRTRVAPVDDVGDVADAMAPPSKRPGQHARIKRVELRDLARPAPRFAKMGDLADVLGAEPTALDGTKLGGGDGVRGALARWMTAPDNPWFSRAFVNRLWGHFLGRGFVDPVDDLRPSNAPAAPELFDALATDFVESGYDVKHLVRIIVGSTAYARSAAPIDPATRSADPDQKLWERFRVVPLGPDELLDALIAATDLEAVVRGAPKLDLDQVRAKVRQRYSFLFDVDEDVDQSDYEGTVSQALTLLNGSVVQAGASILPGSALAGVLAMPGDDGARIDELYVRCLSRPATRDEVQTWLRFLDSAPDAPAAPSAGDPPLHDAGTKAPAAVPTEPKQQPDPLRGLDRRAGRQRTSARVRAWEDLAWALLNSSEFVFNH
jgi:hypothetical protein